MTWPSMKGAVVGRLARFVCVATVYAVAAPGLAAEMASEAGKVSRAVPATTDWMIRVPSNDRPAFRGVVAFDGPGIDGMNMMYPAPNVLGFLVAIAVHGALADSAQTRKKTEIQEAADKVLVPYQPSLDKLTYLELLPMGLAQIAPGGTRRVATATDPAAGSWTLEMVPVFSMTQDERALVLDNAVIVRAPDAPQAVFYQNVVRVVAMPRPAADDKSAFLTQWTADDARLIRQQSATLIAESLNVVWSELARGQGTSDAVHKTVRYPEGGREKIERAALVAEQCDRLVLRTLRGWLMSVPRMTACEVTDKLQAPSVPVVESATR